MDTDDDLVRLEREGWRMLSSGGDQARDFYDGVLDDDVLMLLPDRVLSQRVEALDAVSGQPWATFRLESPRVVELTADVQAVTYGVVARREGSPEYSALVSSVYVRRQDGWRLRMHQQTPR